MSDTTAAEDNSDLESTKSSKSNLSASSGSCCTRLTTTTATTTTTTTTTTDASEDVLEDQLDEPPSELNNNNDDDNHNNINNADATQSIDRTEERSNILARTTSDAVIPRSQSSIGQNCDNFSKHVTKPTGSSAYKPNNSETTAGSSTSHSQFTIGECSLKATSQQEQSDQPSVIQSPSPTCDQHDTKTTMEILNPELQTIRLQNESPTNKQLTLQRTSSGPSSEVCNCLAQDCPEKEHSVRRKFIEHYYSNRTGLPFSSGAVSSLNISNPLNRLSECDAITKRLLSSPVKEPSAKADYISRSPVRLTSTVTDLDKSRRASLGTTTLTDQISIFTKSNQFKSFESGSCSGSGGSSGSNYANRKYVESREDEAIDMIGNDNRRRMVVSPNSEVDLRLKHSQGRSLSVCHEEGQKSRYQSSCGSTNSSNNHQRPHHYHSSNLNRAVSVACDSSTSNRLLTIIPLFGCDISNLGQLMRFGLILPPPIESAIEHILAFGIKSVGIFRKSGVKSRILTLKQRIESNQDVKLIELNHNNEFSIYDIADLVKMWFRELKPTPIMTKELIKIITKHIAHLDATNVVHPSDGQKDHRSSSNRMQSNCIVGDDGKAEGLKGTISSAIRPVQRVLVSRVMCFFAAIASESDANQMTSQNLAICLTPSICATDSDQKSIMTAQKALKYCLDNYRILF